DRSSAAFRQTAYRGPLARCESVHAACGFLRSAAAVLRRGCDPTAPVLYFWPRVAGPSTRFAAAPARFGRAGSAKRPAPFAVLLAPGPAPLEFARGRLGAGRWSS